MQIVRHHSNLKGVLVFFVSFTTLTELIDIDQDKWIWTFPNTNCACDRHDRSNWPPQTQPRAVLPRKSVRQTTVSRRTQSRQSSVVTRQTQTIHLWESHKSAHLNYPVIALALCGRVRESDAPDAVAIESTWESTTERDESCSSRRSAQHDATRDCQTTDRWWRKSKIPLPIATANSTLVVAKIDEQKNTRMYDVRRAQAVAAGLLNDPMARATWSKESKQLQMNTWIENRPLLKQLILLRCLMMTMMVIEIDRMLQEIRLLR